MDWLNYHHLYYFWVVAKEKSISKATKRLLIAQPTISAQLKSLEASAGCLLFDRSVKGVKLTKEGAVVFSYAKKIFETGRDLKHFLNSSHKNIQHPVRVGVENHIPKLLTFQILSPMFKEIQQLKLFCIEDDIEVLIQKLLNDDIDFIFSERELSSYKGIKVRNHLIGSSGIVWLGKKIFKKHYSNRFPRSLGEVPLILPTEDAELRSNIDQWFESQSIKPQIVAELQDTALMKVFASNGIGVFPISELVAKHVEKQYHLHHLGKTTQISQRLHLVSLEKKLHTPAIKLAFERAKALAKAI